MRKSAIAMTLMASIGLVACDHQTATEVTVETTLETQEQKQAYAIGGSVGQFIDQKLDMQEGADINLDRQMVIEGFIAALTGESKLTQAEMQEELKALETVFQEKKQLADAKSAELNIAAGQTFLAENAKKEGVVTTESGLQYQVLVAGEGESPKAEDTVKVHYTGTLIDGTEFDSSVGRGEPVEFPLNRVIPGWTEGVQLMNIGAKYKFFIPSELAYGERAMGDVISPNSVLVFDVELLAVTPAVAETESAQAEVATQ
jgi:FKBP-type peptidyl-prolyl cis-trans isomerase FkpA